MRDDGRHIVIRPLAYCSETDIERYARARSFPIIPCNLCGSQEHLQRVKIKGMLREWERTQPGRLDNIFRSLQSVVPSHLADTEWFDFENMAGPEFGKPSSQRRIHRAPHASVFSQRSI